MQPASKWIWRQERSEHKKKKTTECGRGKVPILSIFLFFIIRYLKQNWALSRQRRAYKKDNIRLSFYLIQPIGVCVCMYLIQKRYRIKCNNTKWKCCNIQCTDTCLLLNKHCQTMWLYFHVIKKTNNTFGTFARQNSLPLRIWNWTKF